MSRLEKQLMTALARASKDFGLLQPKDRVMVCLSGGKDSYALLHLLMETQRRAPFPLELVAVNLDQGQPGFPQEIVRAHCERVGVRHHMIQRDTYSVVKAKVAEGKTYCALCSRLRRGILYDTAVELGCTKIALGHHRDDVIETLLLNLLYSGQMKGMPPLLRSDDGRNVVIRPLVYCSEEELAAFAVEQNFPIVPCDLCGSQEHLHRKKVKRLLAELHAENPNVKGNVLAALGNVRPTHILDPKVRAAMGVFAMTGDDPLWEHAAEEPEGSEERPAAAASLPVV